MTSLSRQNDIEVSEPQFSSLLRGITTTQNLVQFGLKEAKIGRGTGLPYC